MGTHDDLPDNGLTDNDVADNDVADPSGAGWHDPPFDVADRGVVKRVARTVAEATGAGYQLCRDAVVSGVSPRLDVAVAVGQQCYVEAAATPGGSWGWFGVVLDRHAASGLPGIDDPDVASGGRFVLVEQRRRKVAHAPAVVAHLSRETAVLTPAERQLRARFAGLFAEAPLLDADEFGDRVVVNVAWMSCPNCELLGAPQLVTVTEMVATLDGPDARDPAGWPLLAGRLFDTEVLLEPFEDPGPVAVVCPASRCGFVFGDAAVTPSEAAWLWTGGGDGAVLVPPGS